MAKFKPRNTELARQLRNEATPAERELWRYLSASKLGGHKFSRQMPIGPYICDFICRKSRLVVELDGFSHDLRQKDDAVRKSFLENEGYRILRFANAELFSNLEGVLEAIRGALDAATTPSPSRRREGDSQ